MSSQDCPSGPYQPAFTQILSINDYEQAGEQPPPEGQEFPFDEIEEILSSPSSLVSRREELLVMAVNYLQERCGELAASNSYLQLRHQDLLEEINYLSEVEISQDTAHSFLDVMQQEIETYKTDFHRYRERALALTRQAAAENNRLALRVQELEEALAAAESERDAAEDDRNELLGSQEELLACNAELDEKVEQLEQQVATLQESREGRYYNGARSYGSRKLEGEIQAELESLIEKLMVQLENERDQKLKLSAEYKLQQRQLMHLEKELAERNSRIYQLEMSSLRAARLSPQHAKHDRTAPRHNSPAANRNGHAQHQHHHRQDVTLRSKEGSNFKTFSLMSLLNQNVQFGKKTRLIIAVKVIEFYLRKMEKGEFTTQMLENLLVYNYSALYPQACIIRKDKAMPSKEGECTQERLIWNLGFILDNLVNQAEDEAEQKTKPELELVNLINNILEENCCSLSDVDRLKALAEEAIRLRK